METIAAISTPPGQGAVALLRVSGPEAWEVAGRVFRRKRGGGELRARVAYFGEVWDGEVKLDEVLLTGFRGPASFTGEDVVEIERI